MHSHLHSRSEDSSPSRTDQFTSHLKPPHSSAVAVVRTPTHVFWPSSAADCCVEQVSARPVQF